MKSLIQVLDWDSDFFGFKVGRLLTPKLSINQIEAVDEQCRSHAIKVLYWLADPQQPGLGDVAKSADFRFMDFRLEFDRRLDRDSITNDSHPGVRLYTASDLSALIAIAKEVHTDSRFALDPQLSPKSALLFEKWIVRDVSRQNGAVFVADIGDGACGYCTCHPHPDQPGVGQIGLVGVHPNSAGRGLGRALLQSAMTWFSASGFDSVQVVTQGANIAAQRLYQSFGFRTCKTGVWFHRAS